MKNENYLLNLHKIIPLWYEDVHPIGRPKGSVSTTTKLIREHISQAIDGNKIMEMLDKIESPTEYINAISKLLPYSIGKVKPYEEIEEIEPMDIKISFFTTPDEEEED